MRHLALVSLIALLEVGALWSASGDPFAFLHPSVSLTSADRRTLDRGEPLVTMLDADGRQIAVFSATRLDAQVTPERALAWLRQIEQLRRGRYVLASGRFSTPPRPENLQTLTLDEVDLQDIRACQPGRCGLKLAASEIVQLQQVMHEAGATWRDAVQTAFREMVLARVLAFSRDGHAALEALSDTTPPSSPAAAFSRLLARSPFLERTAPRVTRQLALGARTPPDGSETFLYWAKERLGRKAVISATSVTLLQSDGTTQPDLLMIGVQVFATHYLDATLGVTAIVRDRRTAHNYFVYLHRSDVDVLDGCWGPFARAVIESRIAHEGPTLLREVNARMSTGHPD